MPPATVSTAPLDVLVPTRGRDASVRETLRALVRCAATTPLRVVVIGNDDTPPAAEALAVAGAGLPLAVLHEPRRGKHHALNHALDSLALAPLIAVLDDDMTPAPEWAAGVLAGAARHPGHALFAGRTLIRWPADTPVPVWADAPVARGIAFSAVDCGAGVEAEFGRGAPPFPSGNHFWFRRAVVSGGRRFPDVWTTEPAFVLDARAEGLRGMFVPDAVAEHRVQPELLRASELYRRARRFGREMARLQLAREPARRGLTRVRGLLGASRAAALAGVRWLAGCARGGAAGVPRRADAERALGAALERLRRA